MSVAHEIGSRERTKDVLLGTSEKFQNLLLSEPVLQGLTNAGFYTPSPIQLQAIPLGKCGLGKSEYRYIIRIVCTAPDYKM